jgi:hypothetical protein
MDVAKSMKMGQEGSTGPVILALKRQQSGGSGFKANPREIV